MAKVSEVEEGDRECAETEPSLVVGESREEVLESGELFWRV